MFNCKILANNDTLDTLSNKYSWIPSSKQIRPLPEILEKKENDNISFKIFYDSIIDQILIRYFKIRGTINKKSNKMKSKLLLKDLRMKVFLENEYPYELHCNTNHYVMWYTYRDIPDDEISRDIYNSLKKILDDKQFEFVWYENPRMSIPEVYHVQVFWHLI
jgi:hypothetical protein